MAEPVELPDGPRTATVLAGPVGPLRKVNSEWTLIGGQSPRRKRRVAARPTNDADTVVDIRASPQMLARFTCKNSDSPPKRQVTAFSTAGVVTWHRSMSSFQRESASEPQHASGPGVRRRSRHPAPPRRCVVASPSQSRSGTGHGDCPEAKPCRCSHRQGRRSDRDRRRPSSVSALCRLRGVGTPRFGSRLPSRRPDEEGPVAAPPNDRLLPQGLFRFGGGRRY
jgi:hypothetical protein